MSHEMEHNEETEREDNKETDEPLYMILKNLTQGFEKTKSQSEVSIYRVPKELRTLKESAYTPRLVPIGPLHIDEEHLKSQFIKDIKMTYVDFFFYRVASQSTGYDDDPFNKSRFDFVGECYKEMKKSLDRAKECYAEDHDKERLTAEMTLVDGCFILELLLSDYIYTERREEKHNYGKVNVFDNEVQDYFIDHRARATVQHDLLLIGNQLPFFVLLKLFDLTLAKIQKTNFSLSEYVLLYLGKKLGPESDKNTNTKTTRATNCCFPCGEEDYFIQIFGGKKREKDYLHILHIVHEDYIRFIPPKRTGSRLFMPCATELDYAGVKFVAGTGDDPFKVKFRKRKQGLCSLFRRAQFEIPELAVDDTIEPLLRNLIAFEQCHPKVENYFTSYAFLLGSLINSEKDVEVLVKAGIIHNYLGANEDASNLFNNLCKEVVLGEFFFADTCRDAIEYSEHWWPRNIAHVKRTYFASPWTFIAFCVAFIAFGITVAQFILSFF